jgi:hypothetical protein
MENVVFCKVVTCHTGVVTLRSLRIHVYIVYTSGFSSAFPSQSLAVFRSGESTNVTTVMYPTFTTRKYLVLNIHHLHTVRIAWIGESENGLKGEYHEMDIVWMACKLKSAVSIFSLTVS